ncbi:MAG: 30S ribosome-binding factor RbfA [Clostridia bacterium]|nr:30S ribosome-binding factor RbfA [Clostridia bacterium]
MGKNFRSHRVAEEIKKVLSMMLINELKDPRISSMVSVTQVEVTDDFSFAKVYLSVLGSEEEKENTLLALKSAAGFIRKEVGKKIKMRRIPEFIFKIDHSLDYSLHISKIIDEIGKDDKDNHEE